MSETSRDYERGMGVVEQAHSSSKLLLIASKAGQTLIPQELRRINLCLHYLELSEHDKVTGKRNSYTTTVTVRLMLPTNTGDMPVCPLPRYASTSLQAARGGIV